MSQIVPIEFGAVTAPSYDFTTSKIIETGVINACVEIYRRWRHYVSHEEALEQAQQFARRCAELETSKQLSTSELGSIIAAVAEAMAQS
jgi:hypothetical protein